MENGHLCSLWSYWQLWPGKWRLWGCNNRWRVSYIKSQNSQILVLIYSLLGFHFLHHFYYPLPLPWSEIYCLVPYPTSTTSRLILWRESTENNWLHTSMLWFRARGDERQSHHHYPALAQCSGVYCISYLSAGTVPVFAHLKELLNKLI